jgi:hypothetical protein
MIPVVSGEISTTLRELLRREVAIKMGSLIVGQLREADEQRGIGALATEVANALLY